MRNVGTWWRPEWVLRDVAGRIYLPSTPLLLRLRTDGLPVVFAGTVLSTSQAGSVLRLSSIAVAGNGNGSTRR